VKLAVFNDGKVGAIDNDRVYDLSGIIPGYNIGGQDNMITLIESFDSLRGKIESAIVADEGLPLTEVRLQAPIQRPGKILCMGSNYLEGTQGPPLPVWAFFKSAESILGPEGTVQLPSVEVRIFHHEAELVAVIGKEGKNVSRDNALSHVFGYTVGIDVSARQEIFTQSLFNKSHDTFAPIGPYIVTADEIPDPHSLRVQLWVDGQPRHDFNTSDMGHQIPDCLEYVSAVTSLNPGDLIFTGTNHQGIGPMQDGERVETKIERIGSFCVNVSDPLKRSWPKEIEAEMGDRVLYMIEEGLSPGGTRVHR